MEGRFLGLPALAVSLVGAEPQNYETAARVTCYLLGVLAEAPLPVDTILNINVPDRPYADLAGLQTTCLGHRHKSEPVIKSQDPRGRDIYWVGPPGEEQEAGPGTDFHAVREGYVSITPLHVDLTRHTALEGVSQWLAGVNWQ
jgi:5'-nucleotidase